VVNASAILWTVIADSKAKGLLRLRGEIIEQAQSRTRMQVNRDNYASL